MTSLLALALLLPVLAIAANRGFTDSDGVGGWTNGIHYCHGSSGTSGLHRRTGGLLPGNLFRSISYHFTTSPTVVIFCCRIN